MTIASAMTEREAAETFMKARGFKFDPHTNLWINQKLEPGGIHDSNIVACLRFAANGHPEPHRSPTRADIIDMLRQITNVAEARKAQNRFTGGEYIKETAIVQRARKMVDSFKLPAR